MDTENKNWFASKGVWGGIVAVLAAIAGIFGLNFGLEAQEATVQLITQIIAGAGGLLAIWGRVTAKQPILAVDPPNKDLDPADSN
jgi:protein-S-isoprenylcysteine O-methyltransferase Ste14